MEAQNETAPRTGNRPNCLQRADAEAFLAYRRLVAKYSAILVLIFFLMIAAATLVTGLKWKPSKLAIAAIPVTLIPVAVLVYMIRTTDAPRKQFSFFKKLSFRVEAGVYDELSERAKDFAPKERIALGCVGAVLLACAVLRFGLNRYMNYAGAAILIAVFGLLLSPAVWAFLTAKSFRILLQKGEYSAQNKAARSSAVPFAIVLGVILLIAVYTVDRLTGFGNRAAPGAAAVFCGLYLWKRICLNRKYAPLKEMDSQVRTTVRSIDT